MNNQFWREIYDQVDTPVMIFRDDAGNAHLMFVNKVITRYLGYSPESYVLESEHAGALREALEGMLSRLWQDGEEQVVTIPNQAGDQVAFKAIKRAFKSVAIKEALTVVTLRPHELAELTPPRVENAQHLSGKLNEGNVEVERLGVEGPKVDMAQSYDEHMRVYLGGVLKECGGKIYGKGGAAERLKLKPTTLQSKLIKYGVER